MPLIFDPKDLPVIEHNGVSLTMLANAAMLGVDALEVQRFTLEADADTPSFGAAPAERFIYVIRGEGEARFASGSLPLAPESILWIEPADVFSLQAGAQGLDVLLCRAPAGA